MGLKPHPTQKEGVKIHYEDYEGNEYDEVHGDPEQNLEVTSVAEKEGKVQPNEYGTRPDPTNPELTDFEKANREEIETATRPGGEEGSEPKSVPQPGGDKMQTTPSPNK